MRWINVVFVCCVALILQTALVPAFGFRGARPDLLFVVIVFFALFAKRWDAFLIAWGLGFAADMMSLERLGFLTLSYCAGAALVFSVREFLFCYRPLTQFAITLVSSLLLRTVWITYRAVAYPDAASLGELMFVDVLAASLYTAALAPFLHALLLRGAGMFGITRPRYSHDGMPKVAQLHV